MEQYEEESEIEEEEDEALPTSSSSSSHLACSFARFRSRSAALGSL